MVLSVTKDNNEIEVEFIDDNAVVHVIKDEITQKNRSKVLTGTPKCKNTTRKSISSIKNKKSHSKLNGNSNDEEHSENKSDNVLKPKALFEDGDIPGDRIFSFHSKQRQTSTSQVSSQKTPTTSKKKPTKNSKSHDEEKCNFYPKVLFDDKSESESKTPYRKSNRITSKSTTLQEKNGLLDNDLFDGESESESESKTPCRKSNRTTSKSATLQEKNGLLDNDCQSLTDEKFGYETPKKSKSFHATNGLKNSEKKCVSNVNLTSKTLKSEKYATAEQNLTKTPKVLRKRIAKGIAYQQFELLNEPCDSDYSMSSENSDKNNESDSDSSVHSNVETVQPKVNNTNISLRRSTRKKHVSYVYRSDEYFLSKSAKSLKKSKTSDNTLKLLKNPALDRGQVDQLSRNSNITHDKKLKDLYKEITSNFPYWLSLLKEGFNLLLYGFGSKRQIINDFRTSMLEKESVLVINGFFPGLTLKEILESITTGLLDLDSCPVSAELAIQQIEEVQNSKNSEHIYILIHNLDGIELQNNKTQHILSRICSLKNVHLIASIDKVNAALMFDNTKLGDYNFIWMDCTNYLPYTVETKFVESLMVKNTGSIHALSGINNFFKSLTANAKRILLLLIKNRIENKNNKKYGGVPFSTLYRWCRQQFLASTDLALRSQLVEFVDHELIKWKRDADVLYVSVDIDVLVQFYKQNNEDDE